MHRSEPAEEPSAEENDCTQTFYEVLEATANFKEKAMEYINDLSIPLGNLIQENMS